MNSCRSTHVIEKIRHSEIASSGIIQTLSLTPDRQTSYLYSAVERADSSYSYSSDFWYSTRTTEAGTTTHIQTFIKWFYPENFEYLRIGFSFKIFDFFRIAQKKIYYNFSSNLNVTSVAEQMNEQNSQARWKTTPPQKRAMTLSIISAQNNLLLSVR